MNAKQIIFNSIYPSLTKEGVEKMFLHACKNNPIDKVIDVITNSEETLEIDANIFLEYVKQKYGNKDVIIVDYRKDSTVEIDYIAGTISSCFDEKHARYYKSEDDDEDYTYHENGDHHIVKFKDDYNWHDCSIAQYKNFIKSLSRPVEE